MPKRVVVSVISDLVTDQRVHKVCETLHADGYDILLIGSKRKKSLAISQRTYKTKRISLLFQKKVFFYAEFNTRLFFKLLLTKGDIFLGNDLDVMPAVFFAAKLKRKPVVYDTHEYYMGMPELNGRHFVKKVWLKIEQFIFPRLKYIYTICDSFCELYKKDYNKNLRAVRNVPYLHLAPTNEYDSLKKEIDAKIPGNKNVLLFQGAGINPERGVEELVLAMQFLDQHTYHLLIVGGGDVFEEIKKLVTEKKLEDKITIIPKVPFEVLRHITKQAQLGLTLDKPTNINHIYGLPNKIFDYLHCGVPVLSSRLVELEKIISGYDVGSFIDNHQPEHIASCIETIFSDPERMNSWKKNTERVKQELNWEKEGKIVLEIFKQVESETV
jgi:glycosyltransferase involved in cell wall biosynthesis